MYYGLCLNKDGIAVNKGEFNKLVRSEQITEITEEQYNEINEFPLLLIFDEDKKVVAWEKTTIENEPIPEQPKESTIEDYLVDLDFRVSKIELGLEV